MFGKFVLCDWIWSFSIAFLNIVISDKTRASVPSSIASLEVAELELFQCRQSSELNSSGILCLVSSYGVIRFGPSRLRF